MGLPEGLGGHLVLIENILSIHLQGDPITRMRGRSRPVPRSPLPGWDQHWALRFHPRLTSLTPGSPGCDHFYVCYPHPPSLSQWVTTRQSCGSEEPGSAARCLCQIWVLPCWANLSESLGKGILYLCFSQQKCPLFALIPAPLA